MALGILLATSASFLWAITNHIDKYLISKVIKTGSIKGLIVFSSLFAGIVLLPISMIVTRFNVVINYKDFILIFLAASSYLTATSLYLKALTKNDTSIITAMLQLVPVYSYFLGLFFLHEVLNIHQIIGGLIIVLSSISLTYEFEHRKFNKDLLVALILMLLATFLYATYFLLFKFTTINNDFNVMAFWYQVSLIIIGVLFLLLAKSFRKDFVSVIKNNVKKVLIFNFTNEAINLVANMFINYAITMLPMAIVLILNGSLPFFVFLMGLIGMLILPKVFNMKIKKKTLIKNFICIMIGIIGIIILSI